MIVKAAKRKCFRDALNHDLSGEGSRVLATNMAGQSVRQFEAEFETVRRLRPNFPKAVLHISLSAAPGRYFTDAQWVAFADAYLREMRLAGNQHVVGRSGELVPGQIDRAFIVLNRVNGAGEVASDLWDQRHQDAMAERIEQRLPAPDAVVVDWFVAAHPPVPVAAQAHA